VFFLEKGEGSPIYYRKVFIINQNERVGYIHYTISTLFQYIGEHYHFLIQKTTEIHVFCKMQGSPIYRNKVQ